MSDVPPSGPATPRFAPPPDPPPADPTPAPPAYTGPPAYGNAPPYEGPPAYDPLPPQVGDTPPPPPPGLGAAGHYGAPIDPAILQRPSPDSLGPHRTSFVRRAAAALLSNLVFVAIAAPGVSAIGWLTRFADEQTASCEVGAAFVVCRSNDWTMPVGTMVAFAFTAVVSYLVFARPLHAHTGTIGMRQTGITIRMEKDHGTVNVREARRHWIGSSLPQALAGLTVGATWLDVDAPVLPIALGVAGVAALWTVGGALASLVGGRTPWDRWSGIEVMTERDVSWTAVAAALVGSVIPFAAFATLGLIEFDDLREGYGDLTSSATDTPTLVAVLVPIALVTVLAIVLGQVGIRTTRWNVARPAGEGAARAGALLGWSVPVVVLIALVVNVTTDRVESLNQSDCDDARRDIELAISSYQTLNGRPPETLTPVAGPAYLMEAPDDTRWTFALDPAAPSGYRLTAIGVCAES